MPDNPTYMLVIPEKQPEYQTTLRSSMETSQVAVVMVPIPMQSHMNQLLELAGIISSQGISVHFIGSTTHNRQAKLRANGLNTNAIAKIHFHDLPTPPIATPEPNPDAVDKTPVHVWPAALAYLNFREPICALLKDLSTKASRIVVIHDLLIADAVEDADTIPNAESYMFSCISAFNLFLILWETAGKPFQVVDGLERIPSVKERYPEMTLKYIASKSEKCKDRAGDIHNTIRVIESSYIDLLARDEIRGNKKPWAIRPILPVKLIGSTNESKSKHKCLEWLDNQTPKSVIFVSFGTSISLSNDEAKEIAMGLEESKQKFIWVLRDADKADIFSGEARRIELPTGFEERIEGTGMVVRDWAPQLEILAHESTGGFMSHCGWNSCLESITMGVPIAAWPMHSDQPLNAIFLTEILKVGLTVREWRKKEESVKASTITNVVERLMASEEGYNIRERAEKLGKKVRQSIEEGGDSCKELDSFIAHITR